MELTDYKFAMAFIIIVLIAVVIELPAKIIKWLFQNPKGDVLVRLDQDAPQDEGRLEPQYTEQDFWYPTKIKPVRDGVYRVRWVGLSGIPILHFAYWRHGAWGVISHTIKGAAQVKDAGNCVVQNFQWRGVTYD
jgi:hypothetical protein